MSCPDSSSGAAGKPPYPNFRRWPVALAGVALQLCLGTVYAWSFFVNPIAEKCGWSKGSVTWAFSFAICFLGLAAAGGGVLLSRGKIGPRPLAVAGAVLFAAGHLLAAVAFWQNQLWLLLLGYGVVGGIGLGLGYVVPVATAAKWFPDKKGFITGMVIMGFGLGAALMSKVLAPQAFAYFNGNLAQTFAAFGCLFAVLATPAALLLKNPPAAPLCAGVSSASPVNPVGAGDTDFSGRVAGKFMPLWVLFFCNIFVGIAIIAFQSPLFQEMLKQKNPELPAEELAASGALLVAVSALFNGIGRFFWGAISDKIGQRAAFSLMFATQLVVFGILLASSNPWIFAGAVCYVLLCYGGGFGTMPSYILAIFGQKRMAIFYGCVLTAWSAAGIAGPKFMALLDEEFPAAGDLVTRMQIGFGASAALLLFGLAITFLPAIKTPRR